MATALAKSATQFLLAKLDEQATLDGVVLSDLDRTMFLFSGA